MKGKNYTITLAAAAHNMYITRNILFAIFKHSVLSKLVHYLLISDKNEMVK